MKRHAQPIGALLSGAILLPGLLCQPAQAQTGLLNESGTSILADVNGTASGSEALTVSWWVVENSPADYTYTYIVNNPVGDVLLPGSYSPGSPEIFDAFSITFDASYPGAITSTPTGGSTANNLGAFGLYWTMSPGVQPGNNSGPLSFQSAMPPVMGNASASDDNPPSPWSSSPYGQMVPVPDPPAAVPEPPILVLLAMAAGWLATASKRQYCRPLSQVLATDPLR
jgi:hypothetical protein